MKGNPTQLKSLRALEGWREKRRIDQLRARGNPDDVTVEAALEAATSRVSEGGPITRALRPIVKAVDPRILVALVACIAAAGVAAAGYLVGESNAVGATDAAAARQSAFEDAFATAREEAVAQGKVRGREAGARTGRRAAERAGARAGARRGAAAAAQEQAAIAAAAAAAERRARREARAAETPTTTTPATEPVTPEPAPPPEPCFDVAGFPC
jgi:hypothetical protein